jgi:hypothetical protein
MIYVICAFEAEARALIEHYKLEKDPRSPYTLFSSEEMIILISGMGQDNAKNTVKYLLSHYPHSDDDVLMNLGICAAQEQFPIGTLLHVQSLHNESEHFELEVSGSSLQKVSCFSAEQVLTRALENDIAEMEAISLYKAASTYFTPSKISVLKVVSDHFKPFKIKKQFIIDLIKPHVKAIDTHLKKIQGNTDDR